MRVPGNQKRNPMLRVSLKKKHSLFDGRSKEITSLKTLTERGTRHLGDELITLRQTVHGERAAESGLEVEPSRRIGGNFSLLKQQEDKTHY
jgi:hypothetical protein